ncbi:MAG: hypothetical protein ACI4TK_07855 [Agathobacter sp.]
MSKRNRLLAGFIIAIVAVLLIGLGLMYRDFNQTMSFSRTLDYEIDIQQYPSGQRIVLGDDMTDDIIDLLEKDISFAGLSLEYKTMPPDAAYYNVTISSREGTKKIYVADDKSHNHVQGHHFMIKTRVGMATITYLNHLFSVK